MARISGIDLPRDKRIEIALTYIYGIGRKTATNICAATGVDPDIRVRDLSEDDTAKLRDYIDKNCHVEGDLRRDVAFDIKRLIEIGCYRGVRHRKGLPVRGQRTKTNARTRKGPVKTVANKKKGLQMAKYIDQDLGEQSNDTSIDVLQSQYQGIFVKGSNGITINQQQAQALLILQVSLQAALSALLIAFDLDDDDDDVVELQSVIQSIKAAQIQNQKIIIKDSNGISINQQQIQIDALIQLALQLLARLEAKFIEI